MFIPIHDKLKKKEDNNISVFGMHVRITLLLCVLHICKQPFNAIKGFRNTSSKNKDHRKMG